MTTSKKKNSDHKEPKPVRAKFRCVAVEVKEHHNRVSDKTGKKHLHYIYLHPVFSAEPSENRTHFERIPYGEIKLGTLDDETAAAFEVGAEYYVTIKKAEDR